MIVGCDVGCGPCVFGWVDWGVADWGCSAGTVGAGFFVRARFVPPASAFFFERLFGEGLEVVAGG
jgi:hypothetical protein